MTRFRWVWSFVAVLWACLIVGERSAHAWACTTQTCTCDDDCSGLVCSPDGHCCGAPTTGTPCHKTDAGSGAGGAGGVGGDDAGAPPPKAGGGGCVLGGPEGSLSGAAVAASLLALVVARRRAQPRG